MGSQSQYAGMKIQSVAVQHGDCNRRKVLCRVTTGVGWIVQNVYGAAAGFCPVARCACAIFHAPSAPPCFSSTYVNRARSSFAFPLYLKLSRCVTVATATAPPARYFVVSTETNVLV